MEPIKTYACYSKNNELRLSSSSGAIFSALAEYVFMQHGVVYGVAMADDCYSAEFISVTDNIELKKLRGSKYLQAKVGNAYIQVKKDLKEEKLVLFSGTGCQVNGLKKYLGKEYDNLICLDVICHGVPSSTLWKKYVEHQEKMYDGKLININFRCKDVSWDDYCIKEILNDFSANKEKCLYISKNKDSFMQMFLRDYCLRPSCYNCVAKHHKLSDLTIGDFWGINGVAPEMNDGKGTSLILIRTKKGESIFNKISDKLKIKPVSYEDGIRCNPAEYISCQRPILRNAFFDDMHNMSFEELENKYASPININFANRVMRKLKRIIKLILCKYRRNRIDK